MNDDFQFWFFDDDSQDLWMQENFGNHPIYAIYNGIRFAASKNDVFRLCLLYKYGGVYTSINRCFNIKLKDLYSEPYKFLISFEKNTYERECAKDIPMEYRNLNVAQYTIFSPPRHKIIEIAINRIAELAPQYDKVIFDSVKEAIWRFTGPYSLTEAVDEYLTEYGSQEVQFCGIQYNNTCFIPIGSEFRYAKSPSYLGSRSRMILDMDRSGYSNAT
jgi:mannosyltransferase OCH1-like enzyme